jgi:hypothetical protein
MDLQSDDNTMEVGEYADGSDVKYFRGITLVLSRITSRVQHDLRRILIKERKTPFKKKYVCNINKKQKISLYLTIAG